MRKTISIVMTLLLVFGLFTSNISANAGDQIEWGPVKNAVYDNLHPYTLNWSGDVLDRGGLNLSDMTIKTSGSEADMVINQYGSIGAAGILKLKDENLESPTDSDISGFVNSLTMEKGATYLVVLHDGKFAKIHIDRFLPEQGVSITKVFFSYVIEKGRTKGIEEETMPSTPVPSPTVQPASPAPGTGQDSQSPVTQPWSENYTVPGNSSLEYPFSLYLSLNSDYGTIYNKKNQRTEYKLHSPPILYENRTIVPLRFISEALGAKVEWREEDKSILINSESTRIIVRIGENRADVNGNIYELDVAPMIVGASTMVPLRFVSEHLNMKVYYNNGMILITDTENNVFEESYTPVIDAESPEIKRDDASSLYGKWNLWVPGGFASVVNDTSSEPNTTQVFVPGAAGGWIEIFDDGTYQWLDLNKIYNGTWISSGTSGQITLLNGPMDSDWIMRKESDGSIKIYAWGLEYKGVKSEI